MPSDRPRLVTKNGRDFYEVASLLQKSLRRGDIVMCSRAVNELLLADQTLNEPLHEAPTFDRVVCGLSIQMIYVADPGVFE